MIPFNHNQLVLAREARGLTQEQLSKLLPTLNQSNLSKVEKGLLGVTESTLESISTALQFPKEFFLQKDVRPALSNLYYRKQYKINGKKLKTLRAAIKILTRAIGNIMDEVEMDKPFERLKFDISEGWTPLRAAQATREILGINDGPLKNIISKIEEAGIIIYFLSFDIEGFDGVSAFTDNGWPIIFVGKNYSNDRIIMSIAHELAHIVMHIPFIVEPYRDEEKEAKSYAGEFLLPTKDVKADLIGLTYNKLLDLKLYWNVSKAALIRKAHDTGAISPSTYSYLNIERGRRGERTVEDGYVELDSPSLLKKIIGLYSRSLSYTVEDLAALATLRVEDYIKHFGGENKEPVLKRMISTI